MPDARLGERMCAYVVLREGAAAPTLEEVQSFLLQRGLAKNKLPEHLEVIEQMPLNPAGKILKRVLRDRIAETLQSEPTAHQ
jgi:non-ribosomal peptide synthetase component E (peptide arylation enzyme)